MRFQDDYSGGLARYRPPDLAYVLEPLPAVRRAGARLARGRLQGARRLATGRCSAGSASCPCAASRRSGPAGRVRAPRLALVGAARRCSTSSPNWTYGGTWQGLFGRLTYLGKPVFGFRTPSARRARRLRALLLRRHVRLRLRAGWKHDAGKVAHSRNGAFCYSFVPQWTPAGYPAHVLRPPGTASVIASR